jgi:glycosyltransferase involved in cell wall biosynthesis
MGLPAFSVLIRTFNSADSLPQTLRSLEQQSQHWQELIVVDSGSTDATLGLLPAGSQVHRFEGREFNYSAALNQGVQRVSSEYVLIISSHTTLGHQNAVETALRLLAGDDRIGAAYFRDGLSTTLGYELIDASRFDGTNGLWNTCSLVKTDLLRKRAFRPEVFAAEDQEWASWLIHEEGKVTACITGAGMVVHNPRRLSLRKRVNEYVSIAYFSHRPLMGFDNLQLMARAAFSPRRRSREERIFLLLAVWRLCLAWIRQPKARSKYF